MASDSHDQPVFLLGTIGRITKHLTKTLCTAVFYDVRDKERQG